MFIVLHGTTFICTCMYSFLSYYLNIDLVTLCFFLFLGLCFLQSLVNIVMMRIYPLPDDYLVIQSFVHNNLALFVVYTIKY